MYEGLPVIDADAHKMENPVVFFDYLPPTHRARLFARTDRYGQQRLVVRDRNPRTGTPDLERVFPQIEGAGKGAFCAIHPETAIGGVFNRIRIEHMDREGIDAQVLYGSMSLGFESLVDPELAIACMRAYNDYIADDCRAYPGRLFPVGYISVVDVAEAVREVRRCVETLGMIGVHLPPSLPVPHPEAPDAFPMVRLPKHISHPDFAPVLAAAAELDVAVGIHGSPGVYLPSGIAEQVDSFILSHIFGHRNQMQMALSACVFEGVFDRHPTLRMGFLEGGCGWVADLIHAYHEHWEKRIRDFNPDVRVPAGQFARELVRERTGRDGKRHLVRKARQAYGLYRRADKEAAAADRRAFIHEHPNLTHDPVDFFRRGQIYLSFESDDPAPSYLKTALGSIGEDIACFSGDYGHWDGVLTDCVKNVVAAAAYERPHLAKLLAGNCRRFYGRRLEDALARHGTLAGVAEGAAPASSPASSSTSSAA
jgi:predicted TIM-barrel fold metal-dependent hydrolase